jgi:hypothetical protein
MAVPLYPAQVLSSQTPAQNWLGRPGCTPYNASARTRQKHPVSNSTSIVARWFVAAGTCLLSRCIVTALHGTSFTLKMEAACSPEMLIVFYEIRCVVTWNTNIWISAAGSCALRCNKRGRGVSATISYPRMTLSYVSSEWYNRTIKTCMENSSLCFCLLVLRKERWQQTAWNWIPVVCRPYFGT